MNKNALTLEEQELYKKELKKVDWSLPGMEKLTDKDIKEWISGLIRDIQILYCILSVYFILDLIKDIQTPMF